jgi:hypothetical protein
MARPLFNRMAVRRAVPAFPGPLYG